MESKLIPKQFKVTNYRNIDDSGWIPLEQVTVFVGRNESGKTTLLKALHKFNPAIPESYNPQREFPRDRFTRDFREGKDWPVCAVEFDLSPSFRETLKASLGTDIPSSTICTRHYDGSLAISYDAAVSDDPVLPADVTKALDTFSKAARRLAAPSPEQEEQTRQLRTNLVNWATTKKEEVSTLHDLKNNAGVQTLKAIRDEANSRSTPHTADIIETLQDTIEALLQRAQTEPLPDRLDAAIEDELPVFIYFENYGILDSAVYLPRFLEDFARASNDPKVRTINAMFKHVGLEAKDIAELGQEEAADAKRAGQQVTQEMILRDQERKELRAVKTNSASLDITRRFSEWFHQRRHSIRYHADGDYFRIWISDDRRPGVEIELESRSKGFQWFFSFYLVFLVESDEGHQDAILLLDEPGLNLHPTAQQELIAFFEELARNNTLIYSTHSPFLIDGEHIHRVRPVTEDDTGHSRITVDSWPKDRETIFPLQAAAGYAMVRGLFQHKKNVLVEGMSDYLYLHTLNLLCRATGRSALPDDIYITPCGGTKYVGHIASLFLGQVVRPLVLLDGDDAGRVRRDALLKELYTGRERAVLMLSEVLGVPECEIEDILGETIILPLVSALLGKNIALNKDDRAKGSLVKQIVSAVERNQMSLPDGWKPEIARRLAVDWSTAKPESIATTVLDRAEELFKAMRGRLEEVI
ncbi:MAG: AAA family ATPase [Acidobacteria bacterium]|nr:AAA family ATPase [Acidobacteriota bacterium]